MEFNAESTASVISISSATLTSTAVTNYVVRECTVGSSSLSMGRIIRVPLFKDYPFFQGLTEIQILGAGPCSGRGFSYSGNLSEDQLQTCSVCETSLRREEELIKGVIEFNGLLILKYMK